MHGGEKSVWAVMDQSRNNLRKVSKIGQNGLFWRFLAVFGGSGGSYTFFWVIWHLKDVEDLKSRLKSLG